MLSRLRMSIAECIADFKMIVGEMYHQPRRITALGVPIAKYSEKPFIDAIKTVISTKVPANSGTFADTVDYQKLPSPHDLCRT
jgi:hypothetical protein